MDETDAAFSGHTNTGLYKQFQVELEPTVAEMRLESELSHAVRGYLLAIASSLGVSIVVGFVLPFDEYSPGAPGRVVVLAIFFITFSSVMFGGQLIDYWRQNNNDTTE